MLASKSLEAFLCLHDRSCPVHPAAQQTLRTQYCVVRARRVDWRWPAGLCASARCHQKSTRGGIVLRGTLDASRDSRHPTGSWHWPFAVSSRADGSTGPTALPGEHCFWHSAAQPRRRAVAIVMSDASSGALLRLSLDHFLPERAEQGTPCCSRQRRFASVDLAAADTRVMPATGVIAGSRGIKASRDCGPLVLLHWHLVLWLPPAAVDRHVLLHVHCSHVCARVPGSGVVPASREP